MDFTWPAPLRELGDEARAFAVEWAAGREVVEASWLVAHASECSAALAERGWIGMTWPVSAGGHGRPEIERAVVAEALISHGAPIAASWFPDRQIGPVLLEYGTPEQQDRWLPDIVAGRSRWCIGMSEPDAGSDVASIRTRADRRGDDFVVNGQKIWTSGAAFADWCYLICRTDPDAPAHRGLSELVVDMRSPGIEVRPIRDAAGDEHFCEVFFHDVVVPASHLVGTVNGSFGQTMRQLEHERGGIDRLVSNRAVYEVALEHADRTDPLVRQEIARLETGYRIGRNLVLRNVLRQAPAGYSAVTKIFCTELEQRVASFAGRALGPAGMLTGWIGRSQVYAPAYTIMGGTSSILRNIVGERVLGLPR